MARAPETSGSRIALDVSGAMLRLFEDIAPGDNHSLRQRTARHLATIARGCKQLQSYQIDEVLEHVAGMSDVPRQTVADPDATADTGGGEGVGSGESGTGEGQ